MGFEEARPEYYEGLKIFQKHTNQQDRLKVLLATFFAVLKKEGSNALPTHSPLRWKDLGCGDGSFTQKVLDALNENNYPPPFYEGIELDDYFIAAAEKRLQSYANIAIKKSSAFNGTLHTDEPCDIVSGFNALYFAQDLESLREDVKKSLKPNGLGLFIQNTSLTDKIGQIFTGKNYKEYTASVSTEVFFPPLPTSVVILSLGRPT
ncbi:MAG: class I SAM-dependent methyltransferase [Alphaproteobacteria bacterium]|nr:class I SAM-dependent methyltransferase [Alphaproteobacteria bacterium]